MHIVFLLYTVLYVYNAIYMYIVHVPELSLILHCYVKFCKKTCTAKLVKTFNQVSTNGVSENLQIAKFPRGMPPAIL